MLTSSFLHGINTTSMNNAIDVDNHKGGNRNNPLLWRNLELRLRSESKEKKLYNFLQRFFSDLNSSIPKNLGFVLKLLAAVCFALSFCA